MSLSNSAETAALRLFFTNTTWANVGDATGLVGSGTAGSFYISLHTADPGEAGDQTTSEIAYTGYARVAVARTTGGWTVAGNSVSNAGTITFGTMTAGAGGTATYFVIGRASTSTGEIILSGALTNSVVVSLGNPVASFAIGALTATAD
jgi:hypothetical protein